MRKTNATTKRKAQSLSFFSNLPGPTSSKTSYNAPDTDSCSIPIQFPPTSSQFDEPDEDLNIIAPTPTDESNAITNISSEAKFKTPSQDEIQSKIDILNADLVGLLTRQKNGLLTVEEERELNQKKKEKDQLELKLKLLVGSSKRQKKYRATKKKPWLKLSKTP